MSETTKALSNSAVNHSFTATPGLIAAQVDAAAATPESWLDAVLNDFDTFLQDHASCEKKASGMALSVASHYPDQPILLSAMVELAVEELSHYREVVRLLLRRGSQPAADQKDTYIQALNGRVRRGSDVFLMDRLLIGAVVERRGAERFGLIAQAVSEPELQRFYRSITNSEARHWELFADLAGQYFPADDVIRRFNELNQAEADIMHRLAIRPALH